MEEVPGGRQPEVDAWLAPLGSSQPILDMPDGSINFKADRPVYKQLADIIRQGIGAGVITPGKRLPSEGWLAERYKVSRDTVRNAMAELRTQGLIITRRGDGSRVRVTASRSTLHLYIGQRAIARMPTDDEQRALKIDDGVPVLELHLIGGQVELYAADRIDLASA